MSPIIDLAHRAVQHLSAREDKNCINAQGGDMCALPNAGTPTTGIVIGTIAGVLGVAIIVVLTHFHLRRQRIDAREWSGKNSKELDDYGMGGSSVDGPSKPKSTYQATQAHTKATTQDAPEPPVSSSSPPRRNSQDSLRSLEMSLRQQQKPADMV